jgi:hypothetical protein
MMMKDNNAVGDGYEEFADLLTYYVERSMKSGVKIRHALTAISTLS